MIPIKTKWHYNRSYYQYRNRGKWYNRIHIKQCPYQPCINFHAIPLFVCVHHLLLINLLTCFKIQNIRYILNHLYHIKLLSCHLLCLYCMFSAPGWSMLEPVICIQLIIYQQVTKSPLLVGWKRFNAICQITNSMSSIKRSIWNIYKLTVIMDIMFTQSSQTIHTFSSMSL